jgi:hypothetical protein
MRAFACTMTWGRKRLSPFLSLVASLAKSSTEDLRRIYLRPYAEAACFFRLQLGGDKGSLRLRVSATVDRRETDASFIEGVSCFPVSIVLSILICF